MTSINSHSDLDVWMEIMEYFKISPTHDSHSEVKQKQKTLLQIALLSRLLTTPALDLLWETMTSLEAITNVLNSEAEVVTLQADEGDHWMLGQPVTSGEVHVRAYKYLSRIRHLRITVGLLKEMELWSLLVMVLGINPLLPKIQSLCLDLAQAATSSTWLYHLTALLSPSLSSISFRAVSSAHVTGITTLHSTSRSQSLGLTCINYQGHPFPDLLRQCLFFDQLEVLSLDFGNQGIQRYAQTPVAIADIFNTLGCLKDLRIDLRVFPLRSQDSSNQSSPVAPSLRSLRITGDAGDLQEFLLDGVKASTLTSLDISVVHADGLNWKALCDLAASNFPQMHNLSLGATSRSGSIPQLLMQDISSITSRETMTSFHINSVPHCISDINIPGLVRSWPRLRSFMILNDYSIFFTTVILIELSRHLPYLQELAVPLNLTCIEGQLPLFPQVTFCPLRELMVTKFNDAPSTFDGKILLATNLLLLYPLIDKVSGSEDSQKGYLSEVEKLLRAFHNTTAIQTHRRALRIGQKKMVSTGSAMK